MANSVRIRTRAGARRGRVATGEHPYRRGLRCIFCGMEYDLPARHESARLGARTTCPRPSCVARHRGLYGSLEVTFDYDRLRDRVDLKALFAAPPATIWHYRDLLPAPERTTLSEGGTPLIAADRLAAELELRHAFLKHEGLNPTGSFKDRESAVVVNRALEVGASGVTCVSSGNAAASLASYAAHAGLDCLVFTPRDASIEKRKLIEYTGGRLVEVDGSFEDVWELVNRDPGRPLSVAGEVYRRYYDANAGLNPYRSEGDKTTAFEIYAELRAVPDWVVVPVGNGSNLTGIWKGFRELKELGVVAAAPRMLGVQIVGADPVTEAWKQGKDHSLPIEHPAASLAEGIVAKDSYDAPRTLRAVKESGGAMTSVTDPDLVDEMFALARGEGILVEPTSATVLAAGRQLREAGTIAASDHVVFVLTGAGAKTIEELLEAKVTDRVKDLHERVGAALSEDQVLSGSRRAFHQYP